ncbi:MAG: BMP family ABC transporter substrate-binding protein [Anaerolineales bacterium]
MRHLYKLVLLLAVFAVALSACGPAAVPTVAPTATAVAPAGLTFGLLMVGPYNDHGWSQAHYEAGLYVEKNIPGAKMVYVDKVNTSDRPGTTASQLAEDLVSKGAKLVIFNSDDMKDEATKFAQAHPDINVIMASGDQVWKDGKTYVAIPNMTNIMGRMEYGKMMAGCAAALTTQTGQIGYLGALINDETRRLAASVYLGAKYCWTNYLKKDAKDLKFKVTWIGFWFNIPGVTSDPTLVADDFFNNNYDVVVSGIDTTEAITEAKKFAGEGKKVWGIPYDYNGACDEAKDICLGVPYFNWGPAYVTAIKSAMDGSWQSHFEWNNPDWKDINNPDTSAVGFVKGAALSQDAGVYLNNFIAQLSGGMNLWKGPLNLQDKSVYLADGVAATDLQIWYLPQLLEGMEGASK